MRTWDLLSKINKNRKNSALVCSNNHYSESIKFFAWCRTICAKSPHPAYDRVTRLIQQKASINIPDPAEWPWLCLFQHNQYGDKLFGCRPATGCGQEVSPGFDGKARSHGIKAPNFWDRSRLHRPSAVREIFRSRDSICKCCGVDACIYA